MISLQVLAFALVVAPVALVAAGGCGPSAGSAASPEGGALSARSLDELDRELAASCGGPEGVKACAPPSFCKAASSFAIGGCEAMRARRRELSDHFLKLLEAGVPQAAYPLAFLEIDIALPTLRQKLLAQRDHASVEAPRSDDAEYPHAMAFVVGIEALSKRKVADYVALRIEEREKLEAEAGGSDDNAQAAKWLLKKLNRSAQ